MHNSDLITPQHLTRKAVIYIRQSTPHQVVSHQESLRLQYALHERARQLGWPDEAIDSMDDDLGLTAASAAHREGFNTVVAQVTLDISFAPYAARGRACSGSSSFSASSGVNRGMGKMPASWSASRQASATSS